MTNEKPHIAPAPQGASIARANRGLFQTGDARAVECGRKGAAVSPWGRIPFNYRAQKTRRLEMIRAAAEGRAVQPMKLRGKL